MTHWCGSCACDVAAGATSCVSTGGSVTDIAIALGGLHSCALMTGGGIKCWGSNSNGQLGTGGTAFKTSPVDISLGSGAPLKFGLP